MISSDTCLKMCGWEMRDEGDGAACGVLAIDDDEAIGTLRLVDAIADTVGGEVGVKLIAKVKDEVGIVRHFNLPHAIRGNARASS